MYKIIYKKQNGEIIERVRNTLPNYGIGQMTSMGWIIVDILFEYEGNYFTHSDYCIQRRINR